jgi:hypothetical protein
MFGERAQLANSFPAPDAPDAQCKLAAYCDRWVEAHPGKGNDLGILLSNNLVALKERAWPDEIIRAAVAEADRKRIERIRREDREERARLLATPPDRRGRAAKVARELNVSLRRAYVILGEKTPDLNRAKQLVGLFPGTTVDQWYRPAKKTGKRPAFLDWANRTDFDGCRLFDFVQTMDFYEGPPGDLFQAIRKRYRNGDPIPKHVEKYSDYWLIVSKLADERTCVRLWVEYQGWRIERIHYECNVDLTFATFRF